MTKDRDIHLSKEETRHPGTSEPFTLSPPQKKIWQKYLNNKKRCQQNISRAVKFQSRLDVNQLELTFNELLENFDVLRVRFYEKNGIPVQDLQKTTRVPLQSVLLKSDDTKEELAEQIATAHNKPFILEENAFRATLLILSENSSILMFTGHRLVCDVQSVQSLLEEVIRIYTESGSVQLRAVEDSSYENYIQWQSDWFNSSEAHRQKEFWEKYIENGVTTLNILHDRQQKTSCVKQDACHYFEINEDLLKQLTNKAVQGNTSMYAVLLSAFQVLLYHYSSQNEIWINLPVEIAKGKDQKQFGFFSDTVLFKGQIKAHLQFRRVLKQTEQTLKDIMANKRYPLTLIGESTSTYLQDQHIPKDISFAFLEESTKQHEELNTQNTEDRPIQYDLNITEQGYKLGVKFVKSKFGLQGQMQYSSALFDAETIIRMTNHLEMLLQSFVKNDKQEVIRIPLLTLEEKNLIIDQWNDTKQDYPREKTIKQLFEEEVEKNPNAIAVKYPDGELSYAQLNSKANCLANYLISIGVRSNIIVGLCIEKSLDVVIGLLGIIKAGGTYLALDPSYPKARLKYMIDDTELRILLTHQHLSENLAFEHRNLNIIKLDRHHDQINDYPDYNPGVMIEPDSLAFVVYTSGSTGKPKGITLPHRSVVRLVKGTDFVQVNPEDHVAQACNVSWDVATYEVWAALLNGACLVSISREDQVSANRLIPILNNHAINIMFVTTALFNLLTKQRPDVFANMKYLLFGGETVDPKSVRRVLEAGKPKHLLHMYGPSENAVFSTWNEVKHVEESATTVPIGRPIANTQVYILNQHLIPVPIGVPGELCVGGDGLASSYLNRHQLTSEKFVSNPFGSGRIYTSGDLARFLPDGKIEFIGRVDQQVKIRGFRIELGEIESEIRTHPKVHDGVVLVYKDGSGTQQLSGYFVAKKEEHPISALMLASYIKERLPEFMVPNTWLELDSMPLTPNGKVDRKALPKPHITRRRRSSVFLVDKPY